MKTFISEKFFVGFNTLFTFDYFKNEVEKFVFDGFIVIDEEWISLCSLLGLYFIIKSMLFANQKQSKYADK